MSMLMVLKGCACCNVPLDSLLITALEAVLLIVPPILIILLTGKVELVLRCAPIPIPPNIMLITTREPVSLIVPPLIMAPIRILSWECVCLSVLAYSLLIVLREIVWKLVPPILICLGSWALKPVFRLVRLMKTLGLIHPPECVFKPVLLEHIPITTLKNVFRFALLMLYTMVTLPPTNVLKHALVSHNYLLITKLNNVYISVLTKPMVPQIQEYAKCPWTVHLVILLIPSPNSVSLTVHPLKQPMPTTIHRNVRLNAHKAYLLITPHIPVYLSVLQIHHILVMSWSVRQLVLRTGTQILPQDYVLRLETAQMTHMEIQHHKRV